MSMSANVTDGFSPTLRDWLAANAPESIRAECVAACAVRGRRAGRILKSAPTRKGDRAVGVWRAMMSTVCVKRAGMWGLIFASDEQREAYREADEWLDRNDVARLVVRLAAGAPLEFGMLHWNLNADAVARLADAAGIDREAVGYGWLAS